jgi:hypothetical protein
MPAYAGPSIANPELIDPIMFVQTIVCFANSRKKGRRCVAGKSWQRTGNDAWVRPVSRDITRALDPTLMAYQDGAQPALLDIVRVPMQSRLPEGHQAENSLVDEDYLWTKTGQVNWTDIDNWVDTPEQLWSLNSQSAGMLNNRVSATVQVHSSLQLIRVPRVLVNLMASPIQGNPSRRMVVAEFVYHGVSYRLHVTDSLIEAHCRAHPAQCLEISQAVLCVSLGTCFGQHFYKLIASVLFDGRFS